MKDKQDFIKSAFGENATQDADRALRIVFVGHVDHGKSTLIGRLLHETGSILPSKIRYVEEICRERGMRFEYAFLLDALQEEQDQGVTIDVSQVIFKTPKQSYRIIDAPGHKEFLKNMISGASSADAAILLVDAEQGVKEQSKRHAMILSLLGVRSIIVAINKMDLVFYKREIFEAIVKELNAHLASLKLAPKAYVPLSAYVGDNLVSRTSQMDWYKGPTFLEVLDGLGHHEAAVDKPFRLPLQDVYKFDRNRILAGRIESGKVSAGDELLFLPSGKKAVVESIQRWHATRTGPALAGESVGLILGEPIFIERGEVACHPKCPPHVVRAFSANIFWMGERHLQKGKTYKVKLTTQEQEAVVENVSRVINSSTLQEVSEQHREVAKNEVGEIKLRFRKDVVFDSFNDIPETGRFVLAEENRVSGGGIILEKS